MTRSVRQTRHYPTLRWTLQTVDILVRFTFTKFHASHILKGKSWKFSSLQLLIMEYPTILLLINFFFLLPNTSLHEWMVFLCRKDLLSWMEFRQCIARVWLILIILSWSKHTPKSGRFSSSTYFPFCWWPVCQNKAQVMWCLIIIWKNCNSLWILAFIYWIQDDLET
jgi:hypothetical protein